MSGSLDVVEANKVEDCLKVLLLKSNDCEIFKFAAATQWGISASSANPTERLTIYSPETHSLWQGVGGAFLSEDDAWLYIVLQAQYSGHMKAKQNIIVDLYSH